MLTAIVAAVLAPATAEGIAEFFPLNTGDVWHYSEESQSMATRTVDTVGEPIEIGGHPAMPVITSRDDKELDRVYYRPGASAIEIVAFQADKPLLAPYAIIKSPEVSSKWSFQGETFVQGALSDLKLEGQVKRAGTVEFDGKKVEAIEVKLSATILEEFGTKITVTQVATYGRGIGLIKMESTTKLAKRTVKATRTLVAYKPAKN